MFYSSHIVLQAIRTWARSLKGSCVRYERTKRKLEAYVGHHGGFALPSGERVHLLVFGVLTFSLGKENKTVTHASGNFRDRTASARYESVDLKPVRTTNAFSDSTMFQLRFLWLM